MKSVPNIRLSALQWCLMIAEYRSDEDWLNLAENVPNGKVGRCALADLDAAVAHLSAPEPPANDLEE